MSSGTFWAVVGALAISGAAIIVWGAMLVRVARSLHRHHESRTFMLAMPVVGLLASIGTFASAVGFGISSGTLHIVIPQEALTMVASMGRGGLLMGGVIALAYYRPPRDHT